MREAIKCYKKAAASQSLIDNDAQKMEQVTMELQNAQKVYNENAGWEHAIENLDDLSEEEGKDLMTDFQPQLEHNYAISPL